MPAPVVPETKSHMRRNRPFGAVYVAMLLLSLHWAIVTYINSTYLQQFIGYTVVGTLYTIGSALTVLIFLFISRVLRIFGNYKLTLGLILLEIATLVGMGFADSLYIAIPLFVLHHCIVPLMLFNLDVFMESLIGHTEGSTGGKRGILLTVMSLAGALAPLGSAFLIGDGVPRFNLVYLAGAGILLPLLYVMIRNFKAFQDPLYGNIAVLSALRTFWTVKDLRFVFLAHFLLQLFFAWMIIYTPLYLATVMGFAWSDIGVILFAGLMAYVLLEYLIGRIADEFAGEKEMMAFGFFILAISTAWMSFLIEPMVMPWIIVTFMTRVGASFVEATTESYFFKHTDGSDANIISFFRITRPLAIIAGALLGSIALFFLPFNYIFLALGIGMIPGIFFSMMLKDTR